MEMKIERSADYLIIAPDATLDEIKKYPFAPKIIKKAIELCGNPEMTLKDSIAKEPLLLSVMTLADGMLERYKGDWSLKVEKDSMIEGPVRIDLYGLESSFLDFIEVEKGKTYIIAAVATIQNANVPDWRIVLGDEDRRIIRDKQLEGLVQGQKIMDARQKKTVVLEEYGKLLGTMEHPWITLIERFMTKSGL